MPVMDVDWIAGVYAPPAVERTPPMRHALALSAELIDELRRADHVLVCTPMYNLTVPGPEVLDRLCGPVRLQLRARPRLARPARRQADPRARGDA